MKKKNGYLTAGLVLTGMLVALALISFFWTPYETTAMSASEQFLPPSLRHLFGTDNFGRDIFSRAMQGVGTTFVVAAGTVALGALIGTVVGALTGYFGGWTDRILMRFSDAFTAFPSILLALVFVSLLSAVGTDGLFKNSRYTVILALGIVFVPSYTRIVRGEFARARELNYVKAARLMGAGSVRIMAAHIFPNVTQVLLSTLVIGFNNAVLAEAGMSYLGIGVRPPEASLGYMLSESQGYLSAAPWYALSTGLMVAALILGVGMIGEGLQRRRAR